MINARPVSNGQTFLYQVQPPTKAEAKLSKHRKAREITNNQKENSIQTTNQKRSKAQGRKGRERERNRKGGKRVNETNINVLM